MIQTFVFDEQKNYQKDLTLDQIRVNLSNPNHLLWVNLASPTPSETQFILGEIFHFHPLTIEDCLSVGYQPPKIDDFGSYLFLIVHALHPDHRLDALETFELNLYLGDNFVVTCYSEETMPPVERVIQRLSRDQRVYLNGSDFLCHAILDALVDDYMPLVDQLDDELDDLEDTVLQKPHPITLQRILSIKHSLMTLRRILSPQREIINRLTRDEFPMVDKQSQIYFRDIYDHLVRIQDLTETLRDIATSALDIYLNSTSLRLNEVMKALTIVSTIFLPLSFVAGVYGMNFHFMPELSHPLGYPMIWVVFVLIASGMVIFFKKRGWY